MPHNSGGLPGTEDVQEAAIVNQQWLYSFVDPDREGDKLIGVIVVDAPDFMAGLRETWRIGITPHSEVQAQSLPLGTIPPAFSGRLLNRAEANRMQWRRGLLVMATRRTDGAAADSQLRGRRQWVLGSNLRGGLTLTRQGTIASGRQRPSWEAACHYAKILR